MMNIKIKIIILNFFLLLYFVLTIFLSGNIHNNFIGYRVASKIVYANDLVEMDEIEVLTSPNIVDYVEGNSLNPFGLSLKITYADKTTKIVNWSNDNNKNFTFIPSLNTELTADIKSVKVVYENKEVSFEINVTPNRNIVLDKNTIRFLENGLTPIAEHTLTYIPADSVIRETIDNNNVDWYYDTSVFKWRLNYYVDNSGMKIAKDGFYQIKRSEIQIVDDGPVVQDIIDTYYFDGEGCMLTGWLETNDRKKYFVEDDKNINEGKLIIGWKKIDGDLYYFGNDGVMFFNQETPDGYLVGADGKKQ